MKKIRIKRCIYTYNSHMQNNNTITSKIIIYSVYTTAHSHFITEFLMEFSRVSTRTVCVLGIRLSVIQKELLLFQNRKTLMCQFQMVLAPLDSPILKPDFYLKHQQIENILRRWGSKTYLGFGQLQRMGQIEPFRPDHILLSFEFRFEPFQLLRSENCTNSFTFTTLFVLYSY